MWVIVVLIIKCVHFSLIPRPSPRFYLAAVEETRFDFSLNKIWEEAWKQGYVYFTLISDYYLCGLPTVVLSVPRLTL